MPSNGKRTRRALRAPTRDHAARWMTAEPKEIRHGAFHRRLPLRRPSIVASAVPIGSAVSLSRLPQASRRLFTPPRCFRECRDHRGPAREYAGRFSARACGSSVFARSADEVEVNLGSLDTPDQLDSDLRKLDGAPRVGVAAVSADATIRRDREGTGRLEE
jgi:hypothetical protein